MPTPEELLDQLHLDLVAAGHDEEGTGVGRREFLFYSLVTAAASTFGASAVQAQRALAAGGVARLGAMAPLSLQQAAVALGNGEAPALQFQPYHGGTGALLEKLVRERGRAAFERALFTVPRFTGAVPTAPDDICFLPAHRLAALIRERRITSVALTDHYLARLQRLNPTLRCAVTIMEESARREAAQADAELRAGRYRGPLHGLPYGVKDLFSTRGAPTTWGAADFRDRIIDEDAEVVIRLRNAGAVLIAKLSTGLFAQNDQWFGGRTNNPWNLAQGSSGSSAGPASATAAGCVAFSIGTETQGSIVSPAIRCGVSALRPTFGRVSRQGGMVLAWSQDRVGPICRTVEDCAMVFNSIHGSDEKDPSTITTPFQFSRSIALASLRIGVDPNAPVEFVERLKSLGMVPRPIGARPTVAGLAGGGLNVEYAAAFDAYVQRKAAEIGLDLTALPEPPRPGTAPVAAPPVAPTGAPANPMAPADWNPRFVNGRTVRGFEFLQNQRRRYMLVSAWGAFMKDLDMFIAAPAADVAANAQTGHPCVVVPYRIGVPVQGNAGARPAGAAAPAPLALAPQPICAVIVGALYDDDKILSVAHQFQSHTDVHTKRPAL
ncbi:MAG: amidase [Gemmatimonadaceae bacterium]|nr:amidase [Gemmatimonadaceae bacterium]